MRTRHQPYLTLVHLGLLGIQTQLVLNPQLQAIFAGAGMQLLFVPAQLLLKLSSLLADPQRVHCAYLVPFGVLKIVVNRIKELLILLEGRQDFMGKLLLKFSRLG